MSNNWRTVPLSDICDINPRLGKAVLSEDELFAFVPMAAVGAADGTIDVSAKRTFAEVRKGFTPFQSGDVLFAKITPCMENGKMAVVPHLENHYGFGSTEFHVIRPKGGIDPKFVYYYVSAQGFRKEAAHLMTGAVGQKRVPTDFLKHSTIVIPPTIEDQKRIVAEIEKQFSRLDEAVTALKRIQANLKRYKAAVLKAAVEGKLTEQWRKEHPDVEPADQLLKRILTERRAKWEAEELAKMKAKGIKPKDDSWKKKYKEPAGPDTANLSELPEGWVWATVEQLGSTGEQPVLTGPFGSNMGKSDFRKDGVPVLTIGCLREQGLTLEKAMYVSKQKADELGRYQLKMNDMLFSRMATVGRAGLVTRQFEGSLFNYHLMRLRLEPSGILPMYFVHYVRGAQSVTKYVREVNHGATRDGINTEQLLGLPVSLPPLKEQKNILEEIDRRLSVTEELETTIENNLKRAERLRQTILQQVFVGVRA